MGRAVKRAQLPVWYTEGFNPHIYMMFTLPLALGIEGVNESMDLKLTDDIQLNEITERLNAVMPEGMCINRTAEPVRKHTEIEKARYIITGAELDEFFSQKEIIIEKKSKRSTTLLDVKPLLSWENNTLTLPAGNTLNINPFNVLGDIQPLNIKRTEIICTDGELFI